MNQLRNFLIAGICVFSCFNGLVARAQTAPPSVDSILKWDADTKEVTATSGTPEAHFDFSLTNVSTTTIVINDVHTSCGCTAAKLPEQPWTLVPGTNGQIHVTMNLAGKTGQVTKTVTINTDKGPKMLFVKSNILPPAAPASMNVTMGSREANQQLATADRQAVFRGDCASCHVAPAQNKMGKDLYAAACGICHEAEHRASMVPDLHALKHDITGTFWNDWITFGKQGTLMPAFSEKQPSGILSDAQIKSLVEYLSSTIPAKPQIQTAKANVSAH